MANVLLCGTHGEVERRYVCDHLWKNASSEQSSPLAYYEPHREPDEPMKTIWCVKCEEVVRQEDGITAIFLDFAAFHVVCEFCFVKYLTPNFPAEE